MSEKPVRASTILEAYVQCVVDYVKRNSSLLDVYRADDGDVGIVYVKHILSETRYEVFRATLLECNRVRVNYMDPNYRRALEDIEDYLPRCPTGNVKVAEEAPQGVDYRVALWKKARQLQVLNEMKEELEQELLNDFDKSPEEALAWLREVEQ
jgi:hypothetical protein